MDLCRINRTTKEKYSKLFSGDVTKLDSEFIEWLYILNSELGREREIKGTKILAEINRM